MRIGRKSASVTEQEALAQWLATAWAQTPETFDVTVEGARIRCRGWNLAAGDLPGLVLVHGFRAHARWWDHIAPWLGDYRVVALDLSGMGDSDRRGYYSREQHGREILAVAAAAGFDRVTIVAHSFGATGALIACIAAPARIARIVVVDSALPTIEDVGHEIATPPRRLYPDRAAGITRFRLIPPGGWPNAEILDYIATHSLSETAEGWSWKFDENAAGSLNEEHYREKLFGVPVPCDVIYGALSEIMTPARRAQLVEMAPRCGRHVEVPAAHHHVMIEQPIAFVAALRGLLANPRV